MAELSGTIAAVLSGVLVAALTFYVWGRRIERRSTESSQRMVLAAKEELMSVRENLHKSLDLKVAGVDRREAELRKLEQELQERTRTLDKRDHQLSEQLEEREHEISTRLEQIAGLTAQEAKLEIVTRLENEARDEAAALIRNITEQAKKNADREAKKIIALAIQRIAAEQTAESSVSAVLLPSDEMKGRIIGREGRNIRAFEAATGVDVIIDDTPDTVVVSCFEPVRREIGRLALERLIADGRIHPGRIEEIVKKAKADVVNCIAGHHDDVAQESPVSVIVQAADAISGSRPGARREAYETYVKRLGDLEKLASEFKGVEKVFAIQAGREVRVVVTPDAVDDNGATRLTDEIARKIERDLQYPGQIRVVVIRETRAVGVAR